MFFLGGEDMLLSVNFDVVFWEVRLGQPDHQADEHQAEDHPKEEVDLVPKHDSFAVLDRICTEPLAVKVRK